MNFFSLSIDILFSTCISISGTVLSLNNQNFLSQRISNRFVERRSPQCFTWVNNSVAFVRKDVKIMWNLFGFVIQLWFLRIVILILSIDANILLIHSQNWLLIVSNMNISFFRFDNFRKVNSNFSLIVLKSNCFREQFSTVFSAIMTTEWDFLWFLSNVIIILSFFSRLSHWSTQKENCSETWLNTTLFHIFRRQS